MEEENESLSSQVALLEDQLKMASIASSRKMEDICKQHKELGTKLRDLLRLHDNLETHMST